MTTAGVRYHAEVREQPEVLRRLLRDARPGVEAVAAHVRGYAPAFGVIAARGSSDNAARYGQYVLGVHNRLTLALATPSVLTLYGAAPRLERAWAIGISQSGQSPDVVSVLESAGGQGAATVALTNDAGSPLARAAQHCILLQTGEEQAVAATKTYTAELMVLAMLSAALADDASRWDELALVPDFVERTLQEAATSSLAESFSDLRNLIVVGRGFNYSTAFEIALKVEETCYLPAHPYSTADLLHGPVALIGPDVPVLLVAPTGKTSADVLELQDLLAARAARSIVLSDDDRLLARADVALRLPADVPEWLSPLPASVAGQLLTAALAQARGLDLDRPRGLSKVTLTR